MAFDDFIGLERMRRAARQDQGASHGPRIGRGCLRFCAAVFLLSLVLIFGIRESRKALFVRALFPNGKPHSIRIVGFSENIGLDMFRRMTLVYRKAADIEPYLPEPCENEDDGLSFLRPRERRTGSTNAGLIVYCDAGLKGDRGRVFVRDTEARRVRVIDWDL